MRTVRRAAALKALWDAVTRHRRRGSPALRAQLAAVPRMVAMTLTGRYTGVTRGRLGMMGLALLYVVSPIDLVPEAALLLLGVVDDAVVLAWLAGAILGETDAFLEWEGRDRRSSPSPRDDDRVVPGEVLH
jgi:uncharacterized membrane protein YkvA (DUF1232 family)